MIHIRKHINDVCMRVRVVCLRCLYMFVSACEGQRKREEEKKRRERARERESQRERERERERERKRERKRERERDSLHGNRIVL